MAEKITLTFEVDSSNAALLLLAFYDIIENVHPEDSIIVLDSMGWLLDEIGNYGILAIQVMLDERKEVSDRLYNLVMSYEGGAGADQKRFAEIRRMYEGFYPPLCSDCGMRHVPGGNTLCRPEKE